MRLFKLSTVEAGLVGAAYHLRFEVQGVSNELGCTAQIPTACGVLFVLCGVTWGEDKGVACVGVTGEGKVGVGRACVAAVVVIAEGNCWALSFCTSSFSFCIFSF